MMPEGESMLYIGIDLGGTNIAAGLVDEEGKIIKRLSTPTAMPRPYAPIIKDMADLAARLVKEAGYALADVAAVGVGMPGITIDKTGMVPICVNLNWRDVPFRDEFQKHLNLPVYISNDATVAGFAEAMVGASAKTSSSVMLTLGTGVGGGIVIHGKPYSGKHCVGGELGHIIIRMDGEPCTCGNRGCLERYASATALIREGRKAMEADADTLMWKLCGGDLARVNAKTVVDAAKQADSVAMKVFQDYVKALATGILCVVNFIDPEMVVLGGGVALAGDFLLHAVRDALAPMIFAKTMPYASVELAQLGTDAGIIGAAMLGKI